MTNIYRKIFYGIIAMIVAIFVIATIVVWCTVKNKVVGVIFIFLTLYLINAGLALWISTSNVRMTHTKLAWLLSFLVFPIISTLIYLIWGRMPYYAKSVVDFQEEYQDYLKYYDNKTQKTDNFDTFDSIAQYIHSVRKSCVFCDNKIDVILNNIDFYKNILELIRQAKKTILLCYYVILNGQLWNAVKDELIKKADEGVEIYLLFDRYGSTNNFTTKMFIELQKHKNIYICKFESDRDVHTRSANNFRSHKKALIIDNEIALYGGSNLTDEYISINKKSPNWNDLNFVIRGPIIKSFIIDFCIDWDFNAFLPFVWQLGDYFNCQKSLKWLFWIKFKLNSFKKQKIILPIIKSRSDNKKLLTKLEKLDYFKTNDKTEYNDNNKAIFVQTGPRYYNNIVTEILLSAFINAKKSIKIISPYLQLNDALTSALISMKQRGVNVEIISAGSCDSKWFLLDMNRSVYPRLIESGIKIYEYCGFIHSKLVVIDDEYIITGTFNMDHRSFNSNFETILLIKNDLTIQEIKKYWDETIKYSNEYSKYQIFKQISLKNILVQTGLQIIQPLL